MKPKTKKFIKNLVVANVAGIAGGVAGSIAADALTDSNAAISTSSTIAQYLASYAAFFPLHAMDNQDLYSSGKAFKWKTFVKDMAKYEAGVSGLQYLYIIGRPLVQYQLQKRGMDPITSSLTADAICIPAYYALAVPVAKIMGILREKTPENNV